MIELFLRTGDAEGRALAAGGCCMTLHGKTQTTRSSSPTAQAWGVSPWIQLLGTGDAEGQTQAARALGNLALDADNKKLIACWLEGLVPW